MNDQYVRNVIEAALLAGGRPLASDELVALFDERDGSNAEEVQAAIDGLRTDYETRGLELVEVASGYRIQIRNSVAQPVSRLWQERPTKYSRAFLETLALVAYRQPITRGEIEQIRGVAVNPNIIKTLLERGWVRVVGHRDVPGKPELLGTTRDFLDYFGLKKLDDLPTLAQLKELEELRVQLSLPGADPVAALEGAASIPEGVAALEGVASAPEGAASVTTAESDPATHLAVAVPGESAAESVAEAAEAAAAPAEAAAAAEPALHGAASSPVAHDSADIRDQEGDADDDSDAGMDDSADSGDENENEDEDADLDEDSDEELDASGTPQRPHGLVARGAADDLS